MTGDKQQANTIKYRCLNRKKTILLNHSLGSGTGQTLFPNRVNSINESYNVSSI